MSAWDYAVNSGKPTVLVLSRQNLPQLNCTSAETSKGGYIAESAENPEIILMASGSELHVGKEVYDRLTAEGIRARLVSMPSMELFLKQDKEYIEKILPSAIRKRISIEAGATDSWYRFVGLDGKAIGINEFGYSSKPDALFELFGINAENLYNQAKELLK
jgi:Transketolase